MSSGSLAETVGSQSKKLMTFARSCTEDLVHHAREKFAGNGDQDIRAASMGIRQSISMKDERSNHEDRGAERRVADKAAILFDDIVSAKNRHANAQLQHDVRLLIMPWSGRLQLWRAAMVAMVLWAVMMAPLEIAFSWWEPHATLKFISRTVDVMFIIDMGTNFFIVTIKYGRLETKRSKLVKAYLKSWFFLDVITNMPWDLVLDGQGEGKSRSMIKVLKLPKVLRLTRLLRVAREEAHTLGTVFTISGMLLLSHYFACTWIWLLVECKKVSEGVEECPDKGSAYSQGLSVGMATLSGSDAWLRFIVEGPHSGLESSFDWYLSPAWATNLTGMITCLVGLCALGMLFGNLAHAMDKKDSHTRKFNERLQNVKSACQQHGLHKEIHTRARRHFHFIWSCGSDSSRDLLADQALSVDLRRELAFSFYGDLLRKVPFLAHAEDNMLKQLCKNAKMEVFSPPDNIILAGEMGSELFFLVSGSVNVKHPTDGQVLRTLDEGSFFGEVALFFPETGHSVDVQAISFGWLLVVERDDIIQLCNEELLEAFKSVAQERQEFEFCSLGRNTYLKPFDNNIFSEEEAPDPTPVKHAPDLTPVKPIRNSLTSVASAGVQRGSVRMSSRQLDQTAAESRSRRGSTVSSALTNRDVPKSFPVADDELFAFASRMEAKIDVWATNLVVHIEKLDSGMAQPPILAPRPPAEQAGFTPHSGSKTNTPVLDAPVRLESDAMGRKHTLG